jgi:hypothetical protein
MEDQLLYYVRRYQALVLPDNPLGMAQFYRTQLYFLCNMRDTIIDMIDVVEHYLLELEDI